MSIRARLASVIGAIVVLVSVTFTGVAYRTMRSAQVAAASVRLDEASTRVAGLLDTSLRLQLDDWSRHAADEALVSYLAADAPEPLPEAVRSVLATPPDSGFVELLTPAGDVAASLDAARSRDFEAARARLVRGLATRPGAAGGPLFLLRDSLFLGHVAPVSSGEEMLGYLVVWQATDTDATDRAALEGIIGQDATLYLADRIDGVWTDLVAEVPSHGLPLTEAGLHTYDGPEGPTLAAVTPLALAPWSLVVTRSFGSILAPVHDTVVRLGVLGAALLILALLGAWVVSGSLTKPIRMLAAAAGGVGRGAAVPRVSSGRRDEIGVLERAFDDMAATLAASRDELETRIAELTRSRKQLEQVMATSGAVLYHLDGGRGNTPPTWISDNVEGLLGVTPDEARTPGWWHRAVHPDDRADLSGWRARADGERAVRHYRVRHADGTFRWIRDEQRQRLDPDTGAVEVSGAWLDVTLQRDLEHQLRQAQKMEAVGRLAGGVAHDFNNVLTVVLVEAERALAELPEGGAARESVEHIRAAGTSAAMITRQLLTFSRRDLPQPVKLDLNELVEETHSMFQRMVGERVSIELDLADRVGWVEADRGQVEQVLANFVVNARDAMPEGGIVRVGTAEVSLDEHYAETHLGVEPGEYVCLSVTDAGVGMTEAVKEHLFEPFFTTKEAGKGTGLGLATCYAIAQGLGGHIGVYSEVGLGTTIHLYVPRAGAPDAEPVASADAAAGGGSERVLIVEDNDGVRRAATRMLEMLGYEVHAAADGAEALALLTTLDGVDLLMTDLVMPGMGGRELAERVRDVLPDVRVLFMSGYTDDMVTRGELLEQGIVFLHKPFTVQQLAGKVRIALARV
ncbi:MAG: response regulator [Longimicrobiales bacterium]